MLSRFFHFTVNIRTFGSVLLPIFMFIACSGNTPQRVESEKTQNNYENTNLPIYTVTRTTETIVIDGKLEEQDWHRAVEAHLKDIVTDDDVPLKTTVIFLWDDMYLYIGTYFEDPDAWTTFTEEDDSLWLNEVVEFFIDADRNGHNYIELQFNPANAKLDLLVSNAGKRLNGKVKIWREWDFDKLQGAVYVEGDGLNAGTKDEYWTTEVAIPFDDIWELPEIPPKDGDIWHLNVYRIERNHEKNKREGSFVAAYSPVFRDNGHTPWLFGKIQFKMCTSLEIP